LDGLGLQLLAIRGKGYRLTSPLELLSKAKIISHLDKCSETCVAVLEIHGQIDSTNRYLIDRAEQNAASGAICLAEYQTAGKGRRGRQWISPFGSNIYLSTLWRFEQGYSQTIGLSLAIGVAVIRALNQYISELDPDSTISFSLKWPNDIYFQGKKLGGILIEVSGESDGPCVAVIGLGLNLFLADKVADGINQAWIDLSKITGKPILARNQLVAYLINHLLAVLNEFGSVGIKAYLDDWRRYDCLKDQSASLFIGEQPYTGIVRGIDDQGLLLLEQVDGKIQAFASGEISFNVSPP
jgi:BirA family biotin operon repressor/biotin-[acetyl-CoA-carboxylase] ligase